MSSSGIASFRDRTAEFRARVERLQQESKSATPNPAFGGSHSYPNGLSSSAALSLRPGGSLQEHPVHATSKFNQAAKQINDAILLVTERLEKLAALARQRSLYNDPVTEINRLTGSIKQDLVGINRDIDTLSAYMASKGMIATMGFLRTVVSLCFLFSAITFILLSITCLYPSPLACSSPHPSLSALHSPSHPLVAIISTRL